MSEAYDLVINGRDVRVTAPETTPLLTVLRDRLGLRAARFGCGLEKCGACMVLIDGRPEYSCTRDLGTLEGRAIVTPEGLTHDGGPHPLVQAFIDEQAGQCGYCLTGILVSAAALLERNPNPTREEVARALDDNLCRCGVHNRIIRAVQKAGAAMQGGRGR